VDGNVGDMSPTRSIMVREADVDDRSAFPDLDRGLYERLALRAIADEDLTDVELVARLLARTDRELAVAVLAAERRRGDWSG
jgi:hypothetical protein